MMTVFLAGQIDHLHAPLPFCTHLLPEKVCARVSFVRWITGCTDVFCMVFAFLSEGDDSSNDNSHKC